MITTFKLGRLKINLVLRHRFEEHKSRLDMTFRRWELGIWFRKSMVVGSKDFTNPSKWGSNLVGSYMLGVDLLLCKAWIDVSVGAMSLEIPEKKACKCGGNCQCNN